MDPNVKVARIIDASMNTKILAEGVGQMNCHHIANCASIHLVVFAEMSMLAEELLQWLRANNMFVTTKFA